MSRSRGASAQPESETRFFVSSGAPQVVQFVRSVSFWALHHWHSIRSIRTALSRRSPTGRHRGGGVRCAGRPEPRPVAPLRGWQADRGLQPVMPKAGWRASRTRRRTSRRRSGWHCSWCSASASACRTESQNFAPARTWLWQLAHSTVAAGAGAGAAGGAAGPAAAGGGCGVPLRRACCGACRSPGRRPRSPARAAERAGPAPAAASSGPPCPCRRRGTWGSPRAPPWAMPSPAPCRASAWAACRKPPASRLYAVSPASFFSRALSSSSRLMSRLPSRVMASP